MRRTLRRLAVSGAALAAALTTLTAVAGPSSSETALDEELYLVTMVGPGTAGYRGEFSRADYRTGLLQRQDDALAQVGDPEPLQRWTTALSGFAVELTPAAADRLRGLRGVQLVERDDVRRLAATASTAPALGAPGTVRRGGAGTVIGFVDSGLYAAGPVFADSPALGRMPRSFAGSCAEASEMCNSKVVAAYAFVDAFGADRLRSGASLSPTDDQGHGTMVAALAAGNQATPTGVARHVARRFSGAAPDARVAVYKACWAAPDPQDDGCATADVVTAIDQAVADGVDVLNLGMAGRPGVDTVDLATLGATESDIVVVAPAGNDGAVTGHDAPWVTTVGAARTGAAAGALELPDGTRLVGTLSPQALTTATRVVEGRDLALRGGSAARAAQCRTGSLDAARADGRIVVCRRGEGSRLEKSRAVRLAGGDGMVLLNGRDEELTVDLHSVPTVNLDAAAGRRLRRAMADGPVRARLVPTRADATTPAVPAWSGRGGAQAAAASVKPDVVAPGLGLLTASSPTAGRGSWDQISGTSAAAALVSGAAAELRGRRPEWSASRIRSAIVTSARPVRAGVLRAGSGVVDPEAAAETVLVHDISPGHYRRFLRAERKELNLPSGRAPASGTTVLTRSLTNAGPRARYWSVRVTGFRDHDVDVFPQAVRLEPGERHTVRIRVAGGGRAEQGFVVWRDDAERLVRVPLRVG